MHAAALKCAAELCRTSRDTDDAGAARLVQCRIWHLHFGGVDQRRACYSGEIARGPRLIYQFN